MTREEYLSYMREYNRMYKGCKKSMSSPMLFGSEHLKVEPTQLNFKGTDPDEPRCCETFGCGKQLSLEESRFGNKCVNCQNKPEIDVAKHLSFPIKKTA